MTFPLASRQYDYVTPPRAHTSAAVTVGEVTCLATSAVAIVVDLSRLLQPVYNIAAAQTQQQQGVVGNYVTFFADSSDIGLVFGLTAASVSAGNAPVLATNATVNASGIVTLAAGTCWRIPASLERSFLLQANQDLFVGIVAAGNGQVRIYQSSPPNP